MSVVFWTAFASFLIAVIILAVLLRTGLAWRIATDLPNDRSLHHLPVPRVGSLGFMPVWIGAVLWLFPEFSLLAVVILLLAMVSFLDDRFGLSPALRFLVHWLMAGVTIFWLFDHHLPLWGSLGVMMAIVWITNLFNFMDGSDGLAGGMAFFGFAGYSFLALQGGDAQFAGVTASLSGAVLGFLFFNFHPARVFMGDAGSIPLGFLAGVFGWIGTLRDLWPWWLPVLIFSPFAVDATLTLLHRMLRGEKPWQAHREHFYQRLIRSGLGHKKTAMIYYALMLGVVLTACLILSQPVEIQYLALSFWVCLYVVCARAVNAHWQRFLRIHGND